MRDLPDERAHQHDLLDVDLVQHLRDMARKRLPAEARLLAQDDDEITAARPLDRVEPRRGPDQVSSAAIIDLDRRPVLLEVEELLGIDHGERLVHIVLPEQVGQRPGGRLAGIVPPLERNQCSGAAKGWFVEAADGVHGASVPRNGIRGAARES